MRAPAEVAPFDYSEAQWTKIEGSVAKVRESPLSQEERAELRKAADEFRIGIDERKRGYAPPKKKAAAWKKTARLGSQLRAALEVAARYRYGDDWRESPFMIGLCFGEVADFLVEAEKTLQKGSHPFYWSPALTYSFTGRLDPSVVFQQRILWLWTDRFDGRLTITTDPIEGAIGGDLVNYFLSVAQPVMGPHKPSLQSLPDVVDRQKRFIEWFEAFSQKSEAVRKLQSLRWKGEVPSV